MYVCMYDATLHLTSCATSCKYVALCVPIMYPCCDVVRNIASCVSIMYPCCNFVVHHLVGNIVCKFVACVVEGKVAWNVASCVLTVTPHFC